MLLSSNNSKCIYGLFYFIGVDNKQYNYLSIFYCESMHTISNAQESVAWVLKIFKQIEIHCIVLSSQYKFFSFKSSTLLIFMYKISYVTIFIHTNLRDNRIQRDFVNMYCLDLDQLERQDYFYHYNWPYPWTR